MSRDSGTQLQNPEPPCQGWDAEGQAGKGLGDLVPRAVLNFIFLILLKYN